GAPLSREYAGTVLSSGLPLEGGGLTSGFAGTAVATPLTADDIGCPLLDRSGNVSGILEQVTQSGASTRSVFLPAELVLGVARQLVSSGVVDPGWLGVAGSDDDAVTSAPTLTPPPPRRPPGPRGQAGRSPRPPPRGPPRPRGRPPAPPAGRPPPQALPRS